MISGDFVFSNVGFAGVRCTYCDVFFCVFISVLFSFVFDLPDKENNDRTRCLIHSNLQILVEVLSGMQELSASKRVECCLVQGGKLSSSLQALRCSFFTFGWCIVDCICVTGFDVSQARCFKLVRFSCICLAVCCFVFAFGVVSFFDLPIVSLLVLIAAEGHKGTAK